MKINKEKIEKLAKLAYLSFDKEEMNRMISDLEEMLHFVNKLEEVNTDDIRPLTHVHSRNKQRAHDYLFVKRTICESRWHLLPGRGSSTTCTPLCRDCSDCVARMQRSTRQSGFAMECNAGAI